MKVLMHHRIVGLGTSVCTLALMTLLLNGCGQKGPLFIAPAKAAPMPPQAAPQIAPAQAASAPQAIAPAATTTSSPSKQ